MSLDNIVDEIVFRVILSNEKGVPVQTMIPYEYIRALLETSENILSKEPVLIEIDPPIHIVGDIHGNFDDLLRIFDHKKYPPKEKYLFLGDYVDRGKYSVESMILLFCLKVKYPSKIFLLRGNHECENVSLTYGFYDEVSTKYKGTLFYQFHTVFKSLPIAAIVGKKILCLHGGLSPRLTSIAEFSKLEKPTDVDMASQVLFQDILWGDPKDGELEFKPNNRGCGYFFNSSALDKFLDSNGLDILIRSHELCMNGYDYPYEKDNSCITVFSNTNYCGRRNKASVIDVTGDMSLYVWTFPPLTPAERRITVRIPPEWLDCEKLKMQKFTIDNSNNTANINNNNLLCVAC